MSIILFTRLRFLLFVCCFSVVNYADIYIIEVLHIYLFTAMVQNLFAASYAGD